MTPVHQTKFGNAAGEAAGNCLQAALASLFDLPLDSVPHFVAYSDAQWWAEFNAWLGSRFGLFIVSITREQVPYLDQRGYYIQYGNSPRGFPHVVIAKDGEMVHDPHPDGTGLVKVEGEYVIARWFG